MSVVEVREQPVPIVPRYLGRTEASQTVEIRARVSGFLESREFEEGTTVEPGQVLFRIDPRPFEAELAVARARLENARARLERARRQVERLQVAAAQGAASTDELDQQQTEEQVALSDVRLEEARVYQAELDLSYTTIASPIRGRIGRAQRDTGSYIQAGPEGLLAIVQQIDPIYVVFSVSEQELLRWRHLIETGKVNVPDPASIPLALELADGTMFPYTARLNFIGTQLEATTSTTPLRGVAPNPNAEMLPGQFVRVMPQGIVRPNAIVVPQTSLIQTPAGSSVYIVVRGEQGEVVEPRSVEIGEWVGEGCVIESGLRPGDRVVADRVARLRPGSPVVVGEVLPPPSPPVALGVPASPTAPTAPSAPAEEPSSTSGTSGPATPPSAARRP